MLSSSKPTDASSGQGSPVGSLSAENALPDTWHQGNSATWPLLCVHTQSPCACLLLAEQCQDVETCIPCVGQTHLQISTLWLVMLCCRTDFSGRQGYLFPVKSIKWDSGYHWGSGCACLWHSSACPLYSHLHLDSTLLNVYEPSKYFPQATSCHFCARIKHQLLNFLTAGVFPFAIFCYFHCFLVFLQFC